jgi:hypothetical protein
MWLLLAAGKYYWLYGVVFANKNTVHSNKANTTPQKKHFQFSKTAAPPVCLISGSGYIDRNQIESTVPICNEQFHRNK